MCSVCWLAENPSLKPKKYYSYIPAQLSPTSMEWLQRCRPTARPTGHCSRDCSLPEQLSWSRNIGPEPSLNPDIRICGPTAEVEKGPY